jgi:hypothetical protein
LISDFSEELTDSHHYLVTTNVMDKLSVSKGEAQKFDVGRFNRKKLNNVEVGGEYQIKILRRSAALENPDDDVGFSRA